MCCNGIHSARALRALANGAKIVDEYPREGRPVALLVAQEDEFAAFYALVEVTCADGNPSVCVSACVRVVEAGGRAEVDALLSPPLVLTIFWPLGHS